MIRGYIGRLKWPLQLALAVLLAISVQGTVSASPFGQGVFGADVPFGSQTSISVSLSGNVNLSLTPSGPNFTGNGSHAITVTTTDVVGYRLYVYAPTSTSLSNGTDTIPASGNTTPGVLTASSWGYNTDASANYVGMTLAPVLLKDASGPYKSGDTTTVTYGVLASSTKSAGNYTTNVVYTAVAKSQ